MSVDERQPLDVSIGLEDEPLFRPDHLRRVVWAFVGLGVLLRLATYALNFPLWCDEAFVAVNFIARGYKDLLRPLDYGQICPLFFLGIELTAVKLFGFHEWSLRLFPTLCSVASVFLFAHVARRVLGGAALLLAVASFAVAFYPIRHGAEVKPYSSDLFASLVLLALAIEWWRAPGRIGWLWGLVAAVPLALGLSHPAAFMAGGVSLGLSGIAWKARRNGALVPFLLYNVVMVGAFLILFLIFTGEQVRVPGVKLRANYWAGAFPPLREPVTLAWWLLEEHTSRMFAHPFGGERGASSFTTICFVTALVVLWRRRESALLALALGPFGLAFVASALGRYPYGGSARTMLFVAPTICLLGGLGMARLIARLRRPWVRRAVFRLGLIAPALAGLVVIGLKVERPYKSLDDHRSREFARWFWTAKARDSELACVKADLGIGFTRRNWRLFRSALYLCNQKIYSPRHRSGLAANWAAISPARPLRCVLYNERLLDNPAFSAWLGGMTARFDVRSRETYRVNEPSDRDDGTDVEDRYTVLEFVPKAEAVSRRLAGDTTSRPARL